MEAKPIYFGEFCRIKLPAVRANAGMNQREWAKALGVDTSTVSEWENGKREPSFQKIRIMSRLSGIPLDLIFIPKKSQ